MTTRVGVTVTETVLLAIWLGAALVFALVVAPAAFAVLPTRTLAGALVGRILPAIFYAGILLGAIIVALDVANRSTSWTRSGAAGILAVACAVAQLIVGTRIDRLRASIGAPLDSLAPDDQRRVAFGRLHAISVGWLALAMLAAVVALAFAARSLTDR